MKLLILLCLSLSVVSAKHEIYDGYVLYEVYADNLNDIYEIHNVANRLNLDIWAYAMLQRPGQILVSGPQRKPFENALEASGVTYKVTVENIRELLEQEEANLAASATKRNRNSTDVTDLDLDRIYTVEETWEYLHAIAEKYPNTTKLVNAGNSWEGTPIYYLEISTTNFQNTSKPVIFINGLLHAREWVTLQPTLYAIHKLVVNVTEHHLLQGIDWIISPISNPDGYTWSRTNDRFWRKNRRTGLSLNNTCVGVDLNRNFDSDWAFLSPTNVCAITFHGPGPNSEPETQIIVDTIWKYKSRTPMFLDIHSFGSMLLYGWGNGSLIPHALRTHVAGVKMAESMDRIKWSSKPNYRVGDTLSVIGYLVSGSSTDYASLVDVVYSICYELPGHLGSSGNNGFLVDVAFIKQSALEVWESFIAAGEHLLGF